MKSLLFCISFIVLTFAVKAQKISGTISDYYSKKPLEAVSVQTSSGKFALSDSTGRYNIQITKKDSVWFTYLTKKTMKFPVDTITHPANFDVALYVDVKWLPEVKIKTTDYHFDSVENRIEYANAFNFHKPELRLSESPVSSYIPGSLTAGFDLDQIIDAFRFKQNRRMLSFQNRLLQDEQDKYVNHRFSKYLVKKLTNLDGDELLKFMSVYKPSYNEVQLMNDLELGYYIEQCYKNYSYVKLHNSP